jgi:alpha-L-rhamnosidase
VSAEHHSRAGRVAAAWALDGDRVTYTIEVPAQSRGTLELDPRYRDVAIDGQALQGSRQSVRGHLSPGPHVVTFRLTR